MLMSCPTLGRLLSLPCSLVKFSIFVTVKLTLLSAVVPSKVTPSPLTNSALLPSKVTPSPLTNSGATGILSKIQNLKLVTNFFKVNHLFSSITDFNRSLLGFSWVGAGVGVGADGVGADGVDVLQNSEFKIGYKFFKSKSPVFFHY